MKAIETPHDLKERMTPYKLYSVKELRDIIKASHGVKDIGNIRLGSIMNRALNMLETDGFYNYYKKQ